jgi:hypothetical protein
MGDGRDVGADLVDALADGGWCASSSPDAAPALHLGHQQHVGRFAVQLEIVAHVLPHQARGEGPEGLAVLDLQVHHRLHLRGARIADDGATAQRARAEFHATLHQAHHVLLRHDLGHRGRPFGGASLRPG